MQQRFILALCLCASVASAQLSLNYEPRLLPSFTGEALVADGIPTNQLTYAVRNTGDIYKASGVTNRTTAVRLTPGYPITVTITATAATANSSNITVGLALSADGTNYTSASGDMLTAVLPATGGAHTNRSFTTNFTAAVLGGAEYIRIGHLHNLNAVATTAFKVVASVPKR